MRDCSKKLIFYKFCSVTVKKRQRTELLEIFNICFDILNRSFFENDKALLTIMVQADNPDRIDVL